MADSESDSVEEDLLIDFARVTLRRGGQNLVGPITWLGGLAPFLALAAVGAPLFLFWQLWDYRRAAARADPAP